MDNNKQQLITRLKDANNVLVTVSKNPSVDQLAAALGLTLALNRLKKHATAVFSGTAPSVMEFLEPDKTFEKNTDSLRDFIISLDRSKADKLRYKVEDTHVRIYISPYRTSIHKDDLQFSQGEANVDIVVALGVHEQVDLDQAIVAHGKILHDATIATVNAAEGGTVGSIDWVDTSASGVSEMIAQLSMELTGEKGVDDRIATALLTGLVSETERFSNEKTKPTTLSVASRLMEAGANQQLVSEKLQPPPPPPPEQPQADAQMPSKLPEVPLYSEAQAEQPTGPAPGAENQSTEPPQEEKSEDDGTLHIDHEEFEDETKEEDAAGAQIHIDDHGNFYPYDQGMAQDTPEPRSHTTPHQQSSAPQDSSLPPIIKKPQSAMLPEQPSTTQDEELGFGGAAADAEDEAFFDPLSESSKRNEKILQREGESNARDSVQQPRYTNDNEQPPAGRVVSPPPHAPSEPKASAPLAGLSRTLEDIERSVGAHQQEDANQVESSSQPASSPPSPGLDGARQAIIDAMNNQSESQAQPPKQPKVQNPQQPPPVPPPMMPPQQ